MQNQEVIAHILKDVAIDYITVLCTLIFTQSAGGPTSTTVTSNLETTNEIGIRIQIL